VSIFLHTQVVEPPPRWPAGLRVREADTVRFFRVKRVRPAPEYCPEKPGREPRRSFKLSESLDIAEILGSLLGLVKKKIMLPLILFEPAMVPDQTPVRQREAPLAPSEFRQSGTFPAIHHILQ